MRRLPTSLILPLLLSVLTSASLAEDTAAETSAQVKAMFANPPRQFSSGPLWTWNDMLTEDQIRDTLGDLARQKVKQVWVHPRPGLMTPYLDDDWFRLWKVSLEEAERLDMNVWIYDENSYPSGFAGGLVPEAMPEARGQGLHFAEVKQLGKLGDDVLCVFRLSDDDYEDITEKAKAGQALPEGRYLVGTIRLEVDPDTDLAAPEGRLDPFVNLGLKQRTVAERARSDGEIAVVPRPNRHLRPPSRVLGCSRAEAGHATNHNPSW